MSNYVQGFEDDEQFQSANNFSQSSNGSPVMIENSGDAGTPPPPTASKKKRSLPGNPGKYRCFIYLHHKNAQYS